MKLVTFCAPETPHNNRLGALLQDGEAIADLQRGHIALTGSASPMLNDMLSWLDGGNAGAAWSGQR